eukprot:363074-Chlamydomonas_euryale.AAC.5
MSLLRMCRHTKGDIYLALWQPCISKAVDAAQCTRTHSRPTQLHGQPLHVMALSTCMVACCTTPACIVTMGLQEGATDIC